ncbi:TPA_asm: RNA-directed RNA polymerase, partial [ssRNA phage SRR7976325_15]
MSKTKARVPTRDARHLDIRRVMRGYRLAAQDNLELIQDFFIALDTPVALSCYMMFKYGEHEQLARKEIHPSSYEDAWKFRDDFAAISLLRKYPELKTGIDTKKQAISNFIDCEQACERTNRRLLDRDIHKALGPVCGGIYHIFLRKISRILGDFDIDAVLDNASWGPGATLCVKSKDASWTQKFDVDKDITIDASRLFLPVMREAYPLWDLAEPRIVAGNKVVTVPKNAKTDRTIAIEPGLNVWIQLGIGRLIRSRLRSAGFDLNSDFKNQSFAYSGSINNDVATIDFSSASDTISRRLVEEILPPRWYTCLNAARSHFYNLNGFPILSEKFSTMGNGFTFELESLIFVSLALATCEFLGLDLDKVSVFGDDLVLPSEAVPQLRQLCDHLGFKINSDKSFSDGPFRESCGSYFFQGVDVKPLFLKKGLYNAKDLYRFANSVRSLAHRRNARIGCDLRFLRLWNRTVHCLPIRLRMFGPATHGDSVIHSNLDECIHAGRLSGGHEGYSFPGFPEVSICTDKASP